MIKKFKNYDQIIKELFVIAIPTAFESLLFQMVTFFDNFMISYLGSFHVTGVSLANRVTFLFFIIVFGLGTALSAYVSQAIAKKKFLQVRQSFAYILLIGTTIGIIFFIFSFLFPRNIIKLFTANQDSLNFGSEYLKIISLSYVLMAYSFLSAMGFKSAKEVKIPLYVTSIVVLINIVFNYILIFGFSMGIKGAAYATVLARIVEFVFYFLYSLISSNSYYRIKFGDFFAPKVVTRANLKLIIPVLSHEIFWVLSITILHAFYARVGSIEYASFAVASNLFDICFVLLHGMGLATGVVIGHLMIYDKKHVRSVGFFLSFLGFLLGIFVVILLIGISSFAPYIFSKLDSPELVSVFIYVFSSIVIFKAFTAQVLVGVFRASGIPNVCFFIESGVIVFYTLPVAYLLVFYTNLSLPIVVFIVNLEEIIKNIFIIIEFFHDDWIREIEYEELA
ncbi:MATE family efflux transporter [Borreliella burgdorferi]|uniref:MATE family efflux transporter n=1 Tax=Borreliella burgdorferi TaxID=139 RepID=UPI000417338F|nr:MATE family efflux transporter [Borreliella burgdorferi]QXG44547.1 MATE family efflux transporter [Borreliella burgdorferi]WKC96436.1 MATE family efflux transporter [Borreliella burgdorferi]WKC97352.1 MATE family efflux transporter [Borreliella burgdorferi]WNY59513.1 MATE family efflux transporter [Borreliella burgdorferi]WNY61218.1 MATE family efflux transporter [Borreliella burgdorferi]